MEIEAAEGEDRVLATAQHIVKSLGTSENMTRDMLKILSNFDNRLSGMSSAMGQNTNYPPQNSATLEEILASADSLISKWDTNSSQSAHKPMLFQSNREEVNEYLRAVDNLHELMGNLTVTQSSSAKLVRAQHLMQISMSRLEKEFHHILLCNSDSLDPDCVFDPPCRASFRSSTDEFMEGRSSSSSNDGTDEDGSNQNHRLIDRICEIDMVPLDAVLDLHIIAERMVSAGYGRECIRVYGVTRKSVIDESLYRLGVERLSMRDVQKMEWEIMEVKIRNWIHAVKVANRMLFASEKRLCDQVFSGLGLIGDTCFAEITKGATVYLLNFGEAIAISKRSSEKLFKVLDLYETLYDLMPDIETIFCHELCASVSIQASGILSRLGEAARGILTEFENAIQRESSKTPIPGGTVHPLTRYVMNYISFLSDYKDTLTRLTATSPIEMPKAFPDGLMGVLGVLDLDREDELENQSSSLSLYLGWTIIILQCKLDWKSKLYKDVALSYLFLMNNLHYIVQKVKGSELKTLLGDDWLRKNSGKVRQYATNYERAAWMKVLSCLRDEGIHVSGSFSSGVSKQALKERFKTFNLAFEEVHRTQASWIVPDAQLREELRISIAEKLVPAYRSFLGRFRNYLESERHSEMYIKYTPEDLENHLLDLFQGTPLSMNLRRSQ